MLTIPPRVASHMFFRHRLGSLKLAIVFLAIAGMMALFGRKTRAKIGE